MKKINLLSSNNSTFYCFTPLASLVTFLIEIFLAVYAVIKYKTGSFQRICISILFLLGLFQLSEYLVCKCSNPSDWAKLGFACITFLPILGLNLTSVVMKKNLWVGLGYALAVIFSLIIFFVPDVIQSTSCPGKFVIFNTAEPFNNFYEIYYFSYIFIALGVLIFEENLAKTVNELRFWIIVGYLSFLAPTIAIYILSEVARIGTVSVMCGFAVLFALIIVFKIMPLHQKLAAK